MDIQFKTRLLYPDELRLFKILKAKKEKGTGIYIKFYYFIIAGLLGAGFSWLAMALPNSFWTFLFGTLAIILFAFIVFAPYEIFKNKVRHRYILQQLKTTIEKNTVETGLINAKRIALAEEYEDEGDLYIVECDAEEVLYLWDYDYNLRKKFPCLHFEIYADDFQKLSGRQVYPLSGKIEPVKIEKNAKWNYMRKIGAPQHLHTDSKNFDKLVEEYNNCT